MPTSSPRRSPNARSARARIRRDPAPDPRPRPGRPPGPPRAPSRARSARPSARSATTRGPRAPPRPSPRIPSPLPRSRSSHLPSRGLESLVRPIWAHRRRGDQPGCERRGFVRGALAVAARRRRRPGREGGGPASAGPSPMAAADSNHLNRSRSATTSPITTTTGGASRASAARSTMSASVPTTSSARPWCPTGSARPAWPAGRPCAISVVHDAREPLRPSARRACRRRSRAAPSRRRRAPASPWPVTTAKDEDRPRWVSGIPAYAGAATAEVTPGTTSKGIPAAARPRASSPPRPNTKGSPPFSLTTRRPAARARRAAR